MAKRYMYQYRATGEFIRCAPYSMVLWGIWVKQVPNGHIETKWIER